MNTLRRCLTIAAVVTAVSVQAQRAEDPIALIRESDIKADLFALAGDAMRGREGGTLDEMAASVWVAERAREAGLLPAGDNGTYFQFFPLERFRTSPGSTVAIGGAALRMGRDVVTDAPVLAMVDAPLVVMTTDAVTPTAAAATPDARGRVVIVRFAPPQVDPSAPAATGAAANVLRNFGRALLKNAMALEPAAVIVLVGDAHPDQWNRVAMPWSRGTYALDPEGTSAPRTPTRGVPLLYVRESAAGPLAADARVEAAIFTDTFTYPSVNIVAKVPGRDPALAGERSSAGRSRRRFAAS